MLTDMRPEHGKMSRLFNLQPHVKAPATDMSLEPPRQREAIRRAGNGIAGGHDGTRRRAHIHGLSAGRALWG